MSQPPHNLTLGTVLLTPAELPGSGRFWAVYERLDGGGVVHAVYRGLLVQAADETINDLWRRAETLLRPEKETHHGDTSP